MLKSLLVSCLGFALSTFVLADAAAQDVEMLVEHGETGWRSVREAQPVDLATITPVLIRLRRTTDATCEVDPGTKIPGLNMPDTRPLIVLSVLTPNRSYATRATFDRSVNPSVGFFFGLDSLEGDTDITIVAAIVKPEQGRDPVGGCRCRYFFQQIYDVKQSVMTLGGESLPIFSVSPKRTLTKVFTPGFGGRKVYCPHGSGRFVTFECKRCALEWNDVPHGVTGS